ncbi:MAG: nucleoside phosphorylase [Bacteroidales bacterium]|nr:nucleoside phosphorylase [Bacteroidales bacterium]MDP2237677.1 nucleoside phosphorylase [Bacteroidales bacterium]
MNRTHIPASQLPLNSDGTIYHLRLLPEQISDTILLVGDPNRVKKISSFFDTIEHEVSNREIVTHTGWYKGKRITALSTGMGTDNIDIVINELDALVNIDLKSRMTKEQHTRLTLIRLGTSGALQSEIPVGESFVASTHALGLDGLLHFYAGSEKHIDQSMTEAFVKHMDWSKKLPSPYVVKASSVLLEKLANGYQKGVTATSPGFYGPQGRVLRLELSDENMNSKIESFVYEGKKITNFEMESSALYGLSSMLGHDALTICVIIANRVTEKFAGNYQPHMETLIKNTLDRLVE